MANLSADAPLIIRGEAHTRKFPCDNASAVTIYKGHPILINQSVDTTHVVDWDDGSGEGIVAATDIFVGIAAHGKSVKTTDPESGEKSYLEVYVGPTIVGFKSTVYTLANLGDTVYMSDSSTLSDTAADNPQIGKLVDVRDGYCFVQLTAPQVCTGA